MIIVKNEWKIILWNISLILERWISNRNRKLGVVSNFYQGANYIFSEFLSVMSPDGSPNSFPSQSPTSSTSLSLVPASNVTTVSSSSLYITENSSVSFVQQWLRLKKFHNFQSKEIRQKKSSRSFVILGPYGPVLDRAVVRGDIIFE